MRSEAKFKLRVHGIKQQYIARFPGGIIMLKRAGSWLFDEIDRESCDIRKFIYDTYRNTPRSKGNFSFFKVTTASFFGFIRFHQTKRQPLKPACGTCCCRRIARYRRKIAAAKRGAASAPDSRNQLRLPARPSEHRPIADAEIKRNLEGGEDPFIGVYTWPWPRASNA